METPSNSEIRFQNRFARPGVPWALLLALLIVAGVEAWLHTLPPAGLIAYADDESQYHAVRDTIDAAGPAEVSLVGSSQTREGVSMPRLIDELDRRLGRHVVAANYALRGARLDVMDAIVGYLQKQPRPPGMIVVGVAPRDLRADEPDWPRTALFWDWADWYRAYRRFGTESFDALPVMLRNDAGRLLYALRYRAKLAILIQRPLERFGVENGEESNPVLGQRTWQMIGPKGLRSLNDLPGARIDQLFDRARDTYLLDESSKPRPAMRKSLVDLADKLAGGGGRALVVELPVADHLHAELVRTGLARAFVSTIRSATAGRIPFIPAAEQPVHLDNGNFADLQHFNRSGAERFGQYLAGEIAARLQPTK